LAPRLDKSHGVRRLGFGVSGPHGNAMMAPAQTQNMIDYAADRGIVLFDTAPSYGNGEAERRLGQATGRMPRHKYIISTKAGVFPGSMGRKVRNFSPDAIRRSVEGSLRRLKVTYIDWLLLQGPHESEITDEVVKTLIDLKSLGHITQIGIAARDAALDKALATEQFNVFMAPVHIALPQEDLDRLNRIKASGAELIGIETMKPALRKWPVPMSAGSTYRFTRTLATLGREKVAPPPYPMTPEECLWWALNEAVAQRVLMTTTRTDHLRSNIDAVETVRSGKMIGSPNRPRPMGPGESPA
jgi:aryl-alcohol dehydrogenase-like predicted oxidoreductase